MANMIHCNREASGVCRSVMLCTERKRCDWLLFVMVHLSSVLIGLVLKRRGQNKGTCIISCQCLSVRIGWVILNFSKHTHKKVFFVHTPCGMSFWIKMFVMFQRSALWTHNEEWGNVLLLQLNWTKLTQSTAKQKWKKYYNSKLYLIFCLFVCFLKDVV